MFFSHFDSYIYVVNFSDTVDQNLVSSLSHGGWKDLVASSTMVKVGEVYDAVPVVQNASDRKPGDPTVASWSKSSSDVYKCSSSSGLVAAAEVTCLANHRRKVTRIMTSGVAGERLRSPELLIALVEEVQQKWEAERIGTASDAPELESLVRLPEVKLDKVVYYDLIQPGGKTVVVKADPEAGTILDESVKAMGVLGNMPLNLLVKKGILANKKTLASLQKDAKEALLKAIDADSTEGFQVHVLGRAVTVANPSSCVAYVLQPSLPFDEDEARLLSEAERTLASVVRTDMEVVEDKEKKEEVEDEGYDYDSDCSSDPDFYVSFSGRGVKLCSKHNFFLSLSCDRSPPLLRRQRRRLAPPARTERGASRTWRPSLNKSGCCCAVCPERATLPRPPGRGTLPSWSRSDSWRGAR